MFSTPRRTATPPPFPTTTNNKLNVSKSPNRLDRSRSKSNVKTQDPLSKDIYFCHYKNGTYMGGIKTFQKNGRGILLHDNGSTLITSYYNDMLHGQNVVLLPNGGVLSAIYAKDKLTEAVYKTREKIFYAKFVNEQLDGGAMLIDFLRKQIVYANTKKGQILQKSEQRDPTALSRVFEMQSLDALLPKKHIKNISLEFEKIPNIEVTKRGTKIIIGYSKNGLLNGLAFVMAYRLQDQLGDPAPTADSNVVQLLERGYYKNSQLTGLGQRRFKNGNIYVGQFKGDLFQGTGVLKNYLKKNWVSGVFERGNLVELEKYGNDTDQKTIYKILEGIHQRKTSWVSKEIYVTSHQSLDREIQRIQQFRNDQRMISLEMRKHQVLRRIQDNFITETEGAEDLDLLAAASPARFVPTISQKHLLTEPTIPQPYNSRFRAQDYSDAKQPLLSATSPGMNRYDSSSNSRFRYLQDIRGQLGKPDTGDLPKAPEYRMTVHPVPVDENNEHVNSIVRDSLLGSSRRNKIFDEPQPVQGLRSSRNANLSNIYPTPPVDSNNPAATTKPSNPSPILAATTSELRSSPRLTPEKSVPSYRKPEKTTTSFSYVGSSAQRPPRKEDVIDSIYKKQLRRSYL